MGQEVRGGCEGGEGWVGEEGQQVKKSAGVHLQDPLLHFGLPIFFCMN